MRIRQVANSLVARLVALGLAMAIFGTAAGYFRLTGFLRQDLERVVTSQQTTLAEYVARDVDASIDARQQFLHGLVEWLPLALLDDPSGLRDWLRERHDLQPLFSLGLMVADAQGTVVAAYPDLPGRVGLSLAKDPQFAQAMRQASVRPVPRTGAVTGKPVLVMSEPVRRGGGPAAGVLIGVAEVSRDGFLGRLLQGRSGKTGGILLVAPEERTFIASSDPGMALEPTPRAGLNPLHDRAMAGFRGSGLTVNAKGVEEIAAIASVPSTGWFVVARMPTAEAFATVARMQSFIVGQRLVGSLAMLALIAGIVVVLLRPLYRAAEQADRMTLGEVPLAPLRIVRDDEVGHLTTAFNRLLGKLAEQQSELARMAHHDELTGLPNRKLLADRIDQARLRAQRHSTRLALLYMDLDGFKLINDSQGHDAGDEALKQVALRLSGVLRRSDTLARLGGDEFVLLATDLEPPAEPGARVLAQKCVDALTPPLDLHGVERRIGVSIGVALSAGGCSADELLVVADKAMYEAKLGGRGSYRVADADAKADARAPDAGAQEPPPRTDIDAWIHLP